MPSNLGGSTGNNWSALGAAALYGTGTAVGGGGTMARSELDARRMGIGRTPQAQYPDGYLGTINNRRGDRIVDSVKNNLNKRSYTRGVHKGERIDPRDYCWPKDMQPDRGLQYEARGEKAPLLGNTIQPMLVNDGKAPGASQTPYGPSTTVNPARVTQLGHLMPRYR